MAMFGLFKKKEKAVPEKKETSAGSEELRALAAKFLPEEITILAVTGPASCASGRQEGDELYTVGISLTAWMDELSGEVRQGEFRLVTKADGALQQFIAQRLPRDFIVKCKVRPHKDGTVFLLTNLPEPAFDPELKAILEQQKAPVKLEDDDIGTFILNRGIKLFQCEVDWGGENMVLCFDQNADTEESLTALRAILADREKWDAQARARAAEVLLERANELAAEEGEPLTREEFMTGLVPDTLEVYEDGAFRIWYNDDGMLCGSSVEIACSLALGVTGVDAEV